MAEVLGGGGSEVGSSASGEWRERNKCGQGGGGSLEGWKREVGGRGGVWEKTFFLFSFFFATYLAMGSHHGVVGVVWGGLCVGGLLRAGWSL